MKKILVMLSIVALMLANSYAGMSYSLDVVSRYIWRGIDFGDVVDYEGNGLKNNAPAYQPGIEYSFGDSGLAIGAWASFGLGTHSSQELDELDYYLSYGFSKGAVDYSLGYTHYTFPSSILYELRTVDKTDQQAEYDAVESWTSDEISFGMSFAKALYSPSVTFYYDFDGNAEDESKYMYTEIGLSFPTLFGLDQSLTIGIDGTSLTNGSGAMAAKSVGITNMAYGLSKDLGQGFSGYFNLIAITGSTAMAGVGSSNTVNDNGKVIGPMNEDNYEIVFGVNYSGDLF